jgi:hypothetical protein
MILYNHSWPGDDDLDLFEPITTSFMLLRQHVLLTWYDYNIGELPYDHRSASVGKSLYELTYGWDSCAV